MDVASPAGGGKFRQFVKDIINAEREPIRQIESRKAKENDRLKLMQEFLGRVRKIPEAFTELANFKKFRELKADWPAKDLIDVLIDKDKALPGEYDLEVTQLAGRHSMMSDGYGSPDDTVGVGYFTYDLPDGDSKSVWISAENSSLRGIVNAINDQKNLGVQAAIVNDGSGGDRPWRVVITGKKTGSDADIVYPDFYFLDGDFRFYADDERDAQNAIIKFNGFEIMSQANKFELLPGVTLDLKAAKEDYEFTLNITPDIAKMAGKVKTLVDSINGVLEFISKQNKLDADSDTSRTLGGDTALFTIESRLRNLLFENFDVSDDSEDDSTFMRLGDLGVNFQKTGLLQFSEDKFKKVLGDDFDRISVFFTGENNLIAKLKSITDGFLAPERGTATVRERGIKDRIKAMDQDITRKTANLEKRETALKRQFAQLEGLIQSMQGQQQYFQQAMAGVPQPG